MKKENKCNRSEITELMLCCNVSDISHQDDGTWFLHRCMLTTMGHLIDCQLQMDVRAKAKCTILELITRRMFAPKKKRTASAKQSRVYLQLASAATREWKDDS